MEQACSRRTEVTRVLPIHKLNPKLTSSLQIWHVYYWVWEANGSHSLNIHITRHSRNDIGRATFVFFDLEDGLHGRRRPFTSVCAGVLGPFRGRTNRPRALTCPGTCSAWLAPPGTGRVNQATAKKQRPATWRNDAPSFFIQAPDSLNSRSRSIVYLGTHQLFPHIVLAIHPHLNNFRPHTHHDDLVQLDTYLAPLSGPSI